MKKWIYAELEISPSSNYISVTDMIAREYIEEEYKSYRAKVSSYAWANKIEVFEGFKMKYILIEVEYDGRKKNIGEEDVLRSMEIDGLAINKGGGMFGRYCTPTEKLNQILVTQKEKRIAMVDKGLYVAV